MLEIWTVARGSKRSSSFCMSGWSCIERQYGFFCIGKMSEPDDELLLSAIVCMRHQVLVRVHGYLDLPNASYSNWVAAQ